LGEVGKTGRIRQMESRVWRCLARKVRGGGGAVASVRAPGELRGELQGRGERRPTRARIGKGYHKESCEKAGLSRKVLLWGKREGAKQIERGRGKKKGPALASMREEERPPKLRLSPPGGPSIISDAGWGGRECHYGW